MKAVIARFILWRNCEMMTSDYVTGKLPWNTAIVAKGVLRDTKDKDTGSKGIKKEKKTKHDLSGMIAPSKKSVSDLDDIVAKAESQENLPSLGSGVRFPGGPPSGVRRLKASYAKGDGLTARGDGLIARGDGLEGRGKKEKKLGPGFYSGPKGELDERAKVLDKIAAKYGAHPIEPLTKRAPSRRRT